MVKKLMMLVCAMAMTVAANAQFEEGKIYVNTSLTGLDMSYSGAEKFKFGGEVLAGYLPMDNLMVLGMASYDRTKKAPDHISIGAGGRYYILQNGIYLGARVQLVHDFHNYNDVMPGVEVGYAFFLNRHVTVEPALYYDQSFKRHSDYSKAGLRIGFGYYF